jgi:hypothetical protein
MIPTDSNERDKLALTASFITSREWRVSRSRSLREGITSTYIRYSLEDLGRPCLLLGLAVLVVYRIAILAIRNS